MSTTLRIAEEILAEYGESAYYYREEILAAMEEYANQFRPSEEAFRKEPVAFLLSNALRLLNEDQMRELANSLNERLPSVHKNDEPEASNSNEASVASHSSTSGNSIGQFKVLMYGNMLVNSFNLTSGIYEAACPALYKSDDTIEERIKASKSLAESGIMPIAFSDAYCENISKCKFVDVSLSQLNKPQ